MSANVAPPSPTAITASTIASRARNGANSPSCSARSTRRNGAHRTRSARPRKLRNLHRGARTASASRAQGQGRSCPRQPQRRALLASSAAKRDKCARCEPSPARRIDRFGLNHQRHRTPTHGNDQAAWTRARTAALRPIGPRRLAERCSYAGKGLFDRHTAPARGCRLKQRVVVPAKDDTRRIEVPLLDPYRFGRKDARTANRHVP